MFPSSYSLHYNISFLLFIFLLIILFSGSIWTLLYHHFNYPKKYIKFLIFIHQGDFFLSDSSGLFIRTPYCSFIMLSILFLIFSGIKQFNYKSLFYNKNIIRRLHHFLSILICLPLFIIGLTSGLWAIGRYSLFLTISLLYFIIFHSFSHSLSPTLTFSLTHSH